MTNRPQDLTLYLALILIALFGSLAATAYIKSLLDDSYHPDTTLTAIATLIVGASITYALMRKNGRNGG